MLEEFTTLDEIHEKVYPICLLEHIIHPNDERMIHLIQYQFLYLKTVYGLVFDDYILAYALHSVVLV